MKRKGGDPFYKDMAHVAGVLLVSRNLAVAGVAVLFLVLVQWFATATENAWVNWKVKPGEWLAIGLFPVLAAILYLMLRNVKRSPLSIEKIDPLDARKALVLFLSPPTVRDGPDLTEIQAIRGDLDDPRVIEQFGRSPWRMPMVAIQAHASRLEKIVVVPSRDSRGLQNGTWRNVTDFKAIVKHLTATRHPNLDVQSLTNMAVQWSEGVDFEDAIALNDALNAIYESLHEQGLRDRDILVDITGGQKMNSVMGAAVALKESRCFQYVSTLDYTLSVYDMNPAKE